MNRIQQHMKTFQKVVQKMNRSQVQLIERKIYNHDCYIFRFKFVKDQIPLKIGNHFVFEMQMKTWEYPNGQIVRRKYTPISSCDTVDYLDFIIKVYRKNANSLFPNGGKMTQKLQNFQIGDKIDIQGPSGKFKYSHGNITIQGKQPVKVNKIVMIAGGSGITPMYNIITQIIKNTSDKIQLVLLYANKTQQDILLRKQLQSFQPRLNLHLMIDKQQPGWKSLTGYINKQIISQISGKDSNQTFYCCCGPSPMQNIVKKAINEKGGNYFVF